MRRGVDDYQAPRGNCNVRTNRQLLQWFHLFVIRNPNSDLFIKFIDVYNMIWLIAHGKCGGRVASLYNFFSITPVYGERKKKQQQRIHILRFAKQAAVAFLPHRSTICPLLLVIVATLKQKLLLFLFCISYRIAIVPISTFRE